MRILQGIQDWLSHRFKKGRQSESNERRFKGCNVWQICLLQNECKCLNFMYFPSFICAQGSVTSRVQTRLSWSSLWMTWRHTWNTPKSWKISLHPMTLKTSGTKWSLRTVEVSDDTFFFCYLSRKCICSLGRIVFFISLQKAKSKIHIMNYTHTVVKL